MDILDRLQILIKEKSNNATQFAAQIGVKQNTLSQQLNRKRSVSLEVIGNILTTFPDIDPDWLIIGKGNDMIRRESDDTYKVKYYEMLEQNNKILLELNEVRKENARLLGEKGAASAPIAHAAGEK